MGVKFPEKNVTQYLNGPCHVNMHTLFVQYLRCMFFLNTGIRVDTGQ